VGNPRAVKRTSSKNMHAHADGMRNEFIRQRGSAKIKLWRCPSSLLGELGPEFASCEEPMLAKHDPKEQSDFLPRFENGRGSFSPPGKPFRPVGVPSLALENPIAKNHNIKQEKGLQKAQRRASTSSRKFNVDSKPSPEKEGMRFPRRDLEAAVFRKRRIRASTRSTLKESLERNFRIFGDIIQGEGERKSVHRVSMDSDDENEGKFENIRKARIHLDSRKTSVPRKLKKRLEIYDGSRTGGRRQNVNLGSLLRGSPEMMLLRHRQPRGNARPKVSREDRPPMSRQEMKAQLENALIFRKLKQVMCLLQDDHIETGNHLVEKYRYGIPAPNSKTICDYEINSQRKFSTERTRPGRSPRRKTSSYLPDNDPWLSRHHVKVPGKGTHFGQILIKSAKACLNSDPSQDLLDFLKLVRDVIPERDSGLTHGRIRFIIRHGNMGNPQVKEVAEILDRQLRFGI